MAGPALGTRWLLGAPGVPRFKGTAMRPIASAPPPCRRSSTSGHPRSQRALARKVTTPVAFGTNAGERIRLAPLSPRDAARRWRLLFPAKPTFSIVEKSCEPCGVQPVMPDSKPGLVTRLAPPATRTSTSSIRHSPMPRRKICRVSPLADRVSPVGPVNSYAVHWLLAVSSLSAQLAGCRLSLFGSTSSRLLPPPADQLPQRPPLL